MCSPRCKDKSQKKLKPGTTIEAPPPPKSEKVRNVEIGGNILAIENKNKGEVPFVVTVCVDQLVNPDFIKTKNLFKIERDNVDEYIEVLNNGKLMWFADAHEAATVLKIFLRELQTPLIVGYELMDRFALRSMSDQYTVANNILKGLTPAYNFKVFKYLCIGCFTVIIENRRWNKMDSYSLAHELGHCLAWPEPKKIDSKVKNNTFFFFEFVFDHMKDIFKDRKTSRLL